jgi:hypothetical protein
VPQQLTGCCTKEDSPYEVPGPLVTGLKKMGQFQEYQACITTAKKIQKWRETLLKL